MVYPSLVPTGICHTPITICLEDGLGEDGSPRQTAVYTGLCHYRRVQITKQDDDRRAVTITGEVYLSGDPIPGKDITGTVLLGDDQTRRQIERSERAINPDGSINYTKLELIG